MKTSMIILGALLSVPAFALADNIESYVGPTPAGVVNTAMTFNGYSATDPFGVASFPAGGGVSAVALSPAGDSAIRGWFGPLGTSSWVGENIGFQPVGTTNPAKGFYDYETTFSATGSFTLSGDVLADDTVRVLLNGVEIIGPGMLGTDTHCAGAAPGCDLGTEFDEVTHTFVGIGTNTLSFIVQQAGTGHEDPSGVDFSGTVTPSVGASPVPEPSSLVLLASGLFGAAGYMRRRLA
jgi:hypothetical protein